MRASGKRAVTTIRALACLATAMFFGGCGSSGPSADGGADARDAAAADTGGSRADTAANADGLEDVDGAVLGDGKVSDGAEADGRVVVDADASKGTDVDVAVSTDADAAVAPVEGGSAGDADGAGPGDVDGLIADSEAGVTDLCESVCLNSDATTCDGTPTPAECRESWVAELARTRCSKQFFDIYTCVRAVPAQSWVCNDFGLPVVKPPLCATASQALSACLSNQ